MLRIDVKILVDGLFIRSLLMAFFFKLFPEIIYDGRLFVAEPPLYRVDDKKNPFVINMADYINRYVKAVIKDYKLGYMDDQDEIAYFNKDQLSEILTATSKYVEEINLLVNHYKVNDRLLEMIMEEFTMMNIDMNQLMKSPESIIPKMLQGLNIQHLMDKIGTEFSELYYDDQERVIKGTIDGRYQLLELSPTLVRRCRELILLISQYGAREGETLILRNIKTGSEHRLSLLGVLKILKKYQPNIVHRFKGLGENDVEDIKTTIMDPNTRTLIRVNIQDIENDMKIFQLLRGRSPVDALNRKIMMKNYKIPRNMIDT